LAFRGRAKGAALAIDGCLLEIFRRSSAALRITQGGSELVEEPRAKVEKPQLLRRALPECPRYELQENFHSGCPFNAIFWTSKRWQTFSE